MGETRDEYSMIYRINAKDEWLNGAYDEEGNISVCDICGSELRWNAKAHIWYCGNCGQKMDRSIYFNHIGANPPGKDCLSQCGENYPFCKKYCERYDIDPDDPLL